MTLSVGELAVRFGCRVVGDPDVALEAVATLQNARPGTLSFLANPRYRAHLHDTRAGAVVLAEEHLAECPVTALVAGEPYVVYARAAALLCPPPAAEPGVHASAVVAADAQLGDSVHVGAGAVVGPRTRIGARVVVGPGCVVEADCDIGDDTRLAANVTICRSVRIGRRCLVQPGAVIGSDGFGYARAEEGWLRVPQVGGVRIGDDVDIGASTTIDRGAIDDTEIADGVKLDNQIQVAHNVRIGAHTIIAACSGISGSTVIGRRCMIAGAVGFVGHLTIADDVVITGQTMVNGSIDQAGVYSSALPMDEARRWRRNSARFRQLDELAKRLKRIERRLDDGGGGRTEREHD